MQTTQRGLGNRSKSGSGERESKRGGCGAAHPPLEFPESVISELERALQRAIGVENDAYDMIQDAKRLDNPDAVMGIRIAAYNKAMEGRAAMQDRVIKLQEKLKTLVTMDESRGLISRTVVSMTNGFRAMKSLAGRLNPANAVETERILSEEIERVISGVYSYVETTG